MEQKQQMVKLEPVEPLYVLMGLICVMHPLQNDNNFITVCTKTSCQINAIVKVERLWLSW